MNLIIDQGNSVIKIALVKDDKIVYFNEFTENIETHIEQILSLYPIERAIVSSVAKENKKIHYLLTARIPSVYILNPETPVPIRVSYQTPHTLGYDRLAGVIGAHFLKPQYNLLVIDAGTAVTYDFIDKDGNFHGGNISPGLQMRFKALHHFTARLPLISPEGKIPFVGYSTETAIRTGVVQGLVYEMDSYIDEFKKKYEDVFIFLTGGDAFFLAEKLKNSIFADTKLLIKGLNRILNYNADL